MVLEEQKLSQSQLIDIKTAVNLGKMMAAQAIITGSIIDTPAGTEAVGRMIDTETAEILATEKVFCDTRDVAALNFLAKSMAGLMRLRSWTGLLFSRISMSTYLT